MATLSHHLQFGNLQIVLFSFTNCHLFYFSSGKKLNLPPNTTTTTELILTPDGTVVPAMVHHVHHHSAAHHIHVHHPMALGHHHHHHQNHVLSNSANSNSSSDGIQITAGTDGRGTPNGGYLSSTTTCSTPTSLTATVMDNGHPLDMAYFIPVTPAGTVADFASVTAMGTNPVPSSSSRNDSNSSNNPNSSSVTKSNPATMILLSSDGTSNQSVVNCTNVDGGTNLIPSNSLTNPNVTTGLIQQQQQRSPTSVTTVVTVPTMDGGYTVPVTTSKYFHKV